MTIINQYFAPDEAATAQMASDLAAALVRAGHQVRAIASDRSYIVGSRRYRSRETIDGVAIERIRSSAFGRSSIIARLMDYFTFLAGAIWKLLFSAKTDVVIALTTPPMLAFAVLQIRQLRRFKLAFWSMDVYPHVAYAVGTIRRGSFAGLALQRMMHAVLTRADVVIALGPVMAEKLRDLGGSRVEVVHNWANGDAIVPLPPQRSALRKEWGWEGKFVVLYSGNMGLAHEFDTVIAAARVLAAERPELRFAFIGAGPRLAELRRAAESLPNVECRPYVERDLLPQTLIAADLHLVTLREEMAGLVVPSKIYGILAAGRPTVYVGPSVGEIAQIVAEGDCGVVVAIGDSDGLVRAIRRYADDEAYRQRLGANARRHFDANFSRSVGTARFREILETL